jgi:uncharacterized repeat protein (TIGR01451 family)
MTHLRIVSLVALLCVVLPVAGAAALGLGQPPTQEPPLFGQGAPQPKPGLAPVPVVPGPAYPGGLQGGMPQPGQVPGQMMPGVMQPWQQPGLPPGPMMIPPGTIEVPCDPPAPLVKLKVRVVECAAAGQEIEYRIKVENCSPSAAHSVLVRNPLPANARYVRSSPMPTSQDPDLIWVFGTLESGCSKEICLVLQPTDDCDVHNCARVQFEHGQCVTTRVAKAPPGMEVPKGVEPPKVDVSPKAKEKPSVVEPGEDTKLQIKIAGLAKQLANQPAKYVIEVRNVSAVNAENVMVMAYLPAGADNVVASDKGVHIKGVVAFALKDLPAMQARTVELTYKVSAPGKHCLKASVVGGKNASADAEFCTDFEGASAMLLEAIDTLDPVAVGAQTSYRITITNQGSLSLTNIHVRAEVPPEMTLAKTTGPTQPPPADKLPPAGAAGQEVPFAPLAELKPGEVQVYEIFVNAVKAGDARFRVHVTADQLTGGPVMEEESTNVYREDQFPSAKAVLRSRELQAA